eukprot:1160863-Pelagomonas_calceolata.AAC.2
MDAKQFFPHVITYAASDAPHANGAGQPGPLRSSSSSGSVSGRGHASLSRCNTAASNKEAEGGWAAR